MPSSFLRNYLTELTALFENVSLNEFIDFTTELTESLKRPSYIFICGNGGSASNASHFACDINKETSYRKDKRFKLICLSDNIPTILAYANDVSYDDVFVEQLKNFLTKDDMVIGVSVSGNSRNVLKAIDYANKNGGKTYGICGCGGGELKNISQKSLTIDSNDMQKVEDLHMIIFHCTMKYLSLYK